MKKFCFLFLILSLNLISLEAKVTECQVYFSPEDSVAERLITMIKKEDKSIKIAMFCLTHQEIIKSLIQAKKRGVDVEVIVDPFSMKRRAKIASLVKAKIPVFIWEPKQEENNGKKPLMHHKFCVFGKNAVWTGSFNFTYDAATANQENAIVLHDEELASRFEEKFQALKKKGAISYNEYEVAHTKVKVNS